ncbi:MAG: hypothetical protein RL338_752 [Chloroflexota bacterium]|jgi:diadenosine tetraphosphatase ApaH/serine/threonine PP2A family protein phosphatase
MRIAVLSDIHSNLVALDAVLADAGEVDGIWVLGDVVGYGPDPDGVVARLAARGATGVRGNHDAVATGDDDASFFNPEARTAALWTRDAIADGTRAWLAALPERSVEGAFTLVHGSPRDPMWEYVVSAGIAKENLEAFGTPHCLNGHTHVPVAFRASGGTVGSAGPGPVPLSLEGTRSLVNPGSVGQPRDGDPRASYAILDPVAATVEWRRVAYDIRATQAAIRARGLPERLAARLEHGH